MLDDFKALVNSGTNCVDSSDFSCAETCVQLDSVFEYSNFVENLFRSRLGKCKRYWIWDNKVTAFESMLNMTPAGKFDSKIRRMELVAQSSSLVSSVGRALDF